MLTRVASIHFAPVKAERSIYGGYYALPAVPLAGDPAIIEVADRVQHDEGPITSGPGGGRRQPLHYAVYGHEIAADIVGQWTSNSLGMTPDSHPGIWVVRDAIHATRIDQNGDEIALLDGFNKQVFRPATPEEAKRMWTEDVANARRADRAYAEWCYIKGNEIASDARMIQFVSRNYKLAARQYGLEADWLREGAELEVRPCISCTRVISKRAIVCPLCQQVNDFERYAVLQAQKDNALREEKKRQQAA